MAMQIMLLWLDGQLTLQTGLPLHLCGLFGVLSIPMLLWRAPQPLYELSAFLAGPAAAVTLLWFAQPRPALPCHAPPRLDKISPAYKARREVCFWGGEEGMADITGSGASTSG